jgi:threonine synthase
LAAWEGVFVEPASAASVAGMMKAIKKGGLPKGSTIVCINTGNGLKDPDNAIKECKSPIVCKNNVNEVLEAIR